MRWRHVDSRRSIPGFPGAKRTGQINGRRVVTKREHAEALDQAPRWPGGARPPATASARRWRPSDMAGPPQRHVSWGAHDDELRSRPGAAGGSSTLHKPATAAAYRWETIFLGNNAARDSFGMWTTPVVPKSLRLHPHLRPKIASCKSRAAIPAARTRGLGKRTRGKRARAAVSV